MLNDRLSGAWRAGPLTIRIAAALTFSIGTLQCKSPSQASPELASSVNANASKQGDGALLRLGAPLPDVSAVAQTGDLVRLRELKGKPVVVYFYPKDDTPGCTVEAQEIRDLWQEIRDTDAVVVGVSADDVASHRAFAEKHALPFLLLPDPEHRISTAFGVPLKNGRARRVSFVFGRGGELVKVFPEVTPKGHGRELLDTLRRLKG